MPVFPTSQAAQSCASNGLSAPLIGDWCNSVRNRHLVKDEGKREWRTSVGYSNLPLWPEGPDVAVPTLALEVREVRKTGAQVFTVAAAPLTEFLVEKGLASNETEWETRLSAPFDVVARGMTEWLKLTAEATAKYLERPKA